MTYPLSNRPKAYSYVRFSTPDQMKGDSFRRQVEAAEKYAALKGLEMDTKFTFHDLGVSAFQGRNKAEGMLGEFLAFVRSGDIAKGSYLLVENLDRVSRENALDALRVLEDIAREDITVVTLGDGKEYTYEGMRKNFVDLMIALLLFARANEESETKARRLREAWNAKRRVAKDRPLSALCPGWLRLREDRGGFDVIYERAEIVRRVFDMTLAGIGQHEIAKALNREDVPVFGRGKVWHRTYIKKMLADPATIGRFTPHRTERVNGKKVRIPTDSVEGYFPAIIELGMFERVAAISNGRAAPTRAGQLANILAGLAKCPRCGDTMTRVNKGNSKKCGRPYLVCTRAKAGAGCEYRQVRLSDVADAIIAEAGQLLVDMPSPNEGLQEQWDRLTAAEGGADLEIDRVVEAIGEAGHSRALLDRLRELEAARDEIRVELGDVEGRIAATLTNRVQDTVSDLVDLTEAEPLDVAKINATLRQLFVRVEVDYPQGQLRFHWKHAPGEITSVMYAWPRVP